MANRLDPPRPREIEDRGVHAVLVGGPADGRIVEVSCTKELKIPRFLEGTMVTEADGSIRVGPPKIDALLYEPAEPIVFLHRSEEADAACEAGEADHYRFQGGDL